jgi:Zn-finger nucleic acid-binding protein
MSTKKCPDCKDTVLRRADRRGVEIDYCPDCNGIWLDSGELNKIVEASRKAAELEDKTAPAVKKDSSLKSFFSFLGKTKVEMDDNDDDDDSFSSDFSDSESDSDSGCDSDSGGCDDN